MQLSNQAIGAIMMALQESLMNQSDIVPVFQGFELMETNDGLVVKLVKMKISISEQDIVRIIIYMKNNIKLSFITYHLFNVLKYHL